MLSEKLRELRKKSKFLQSDVAKKIGVARTTYAMYEQGNREPDFETLQKIADIYEVSTDYLLGRNEQIVIPDILKEEDNFFYFNKDGLTQDEVEILEESYKMMKDRARKRAEEKKKRANGGSDFKNN